MTNQIESTKENANDWDKYWSGVAGIGAFSDGGVSHPSITAYWQHYFKHSAASREGGSPQIIDIASGNGALIEVAAQVFGAEKLEFTSLDLSPSAIQQLVTRFPNVKGLVADANAIPVQDNCTDMVISQFGIEYAGLDAIDEAIRVVSNTGSIALMMHCDNSVIYQESKTNLEVIEKILNADILPLAKQLFTARANLSKAGDKQRLIYEELAHQFGLALIELENIMTEFGIAAAGGFVHKLYNDMADVHEKFAHYVLSDVLRWLINVEIELIAYKGRMTAMLEASLDEAQFTEIKHKFKSSNFNINVADKLFSPGNHRPLAWVFSARSQQ